MNTENPILIARGLIERHGIRAVALAETRLQEAQWAGDTAAQEHWSAVVAATLELRRSARQATEPVVH